MTLWAIQLGYGWEKYTEIAEGTWWKRSIEVQSEIYKEAHSADFEAQFHDDGGYQKFLDAERDTDKAKADGIFDNK